MINPTSPLGKGPCKYLSTNCVSFIWGKIKSFTAAISNYAFRCGPRQIKYTKARCLRIKAGGPLFYMPSFFYGSEGLPLFLCFASSAFFSYLIRCHWKKKESNFNLHLFLQCFPFLYLGHNPGISLFLIPFHKLFLLLL